jgi:cell wall-associated NlpC family hydrolase
MRRICIRGNAVILSILFLILSCSSDNKTDDINPESRHSLPEHTRAFVNVNIADIKKEPQRHSERISQALYNEVVEVLQADVRYAEIRQSDGYEGWIRTYYLERITDFADKDSFIVDNYLVAAYEKPDGESGRKTMFPYGCKLFGDIDGSYLRVKSSRYGTVYVGLSDLKRISADIYSMVPDSASISREAEKFMGAPYLWGGKSFYGIDCSGLTQIVMRRFGVELPRDSKDQMTQGIEIKRDDARAGDLLFFPNHVGLAVAKDLMIHSTGRNGGVAYNSLDPQSPIYSEYHDKNFISARRVIPRKESR